MLQGEQRARGTVSCLELSVCVETLPAHLQMRTGVGDKMGGGQDDETLRTIVR